MEEEVDLRNYIDVLIRNSWLIVGVTVLAALAALVVSTLNYRPTYEATAGILVARARSRVIFDPRFQTLDSDQASRYAAVDEQARRQALVALVKNGAIARRVAEQLKGELDRMELNLAGLLGQVSGQLWEPEGGARGATEYSDFIAITAASSDPAKAVLIANTWAQLYEEYVNEIYGDRPESYVSVQEQVIEAQETYQQAEDALTAHIAVSRADSLNRLISQKETIINGVQVSMTQAVAIELGDRFHVLSEHYETKRRMERLLEDVRALYVQVQEGGTNGAETNRLALLMLKAEAYATSTGLPGKLQLQVELSGGTSPTVSGQQADVKALIDVVENRVAELERAIAEESAALFQSGGYASLSLPALRTGAGEAARSSAAEGSIGQLLDELDEELRDLKAELASEEATERELVRARDLAWETYSTLRVKADELRIEAGMVDVEVRFASPAVEPTRPLESNVQRNVVVAAAAGFALSLLIAFLLHYLGLEYDAWAALRAFRKRTGGAS